MELEEFLGSLKKEEENKDLQYPIKKLKIYEDYVMLYLEEEKIQLSVDSYFEHKIKDLKGLDEIAKKVGYSDKSGVSKFITRYEQLKRK